MTLILTIFALAIACSAADLLLKIAGRNPGTVDVRLFLVGSVLYILTLPVWLLLLRTKTLSSLGAIYSVFYCLILVGTDLVFYRASVRAGELVGILLALVAIVLLRRFS